MKGFRSGPSHPDMYMYHSRYLTATALTIPNGEEAIDAIDRQIW
ncbi:MAG: hypothetical protein QOC98_3221 [Frankiaceae bacterium]|jgi:hypothetical protein|nr:hypothetical protein [Frankiaceae bacterium]